MTISINLFVTALYLRLYVTHHHFSPSVLFSHPLLSLNASTSSSSIGLNPNPSLSFAGHHSGFGRTRTDRAEAEAGVRVVRVEEEEMTLEPKNLRSSEVGSRY